MERECILSLRNNFDLVELPVLESGSDRLNDLSVPQNLDKSAPFERWSTESRGMKEVDLIVLSRDGVKRINSRECSAESVGACCGPKQTDRVPAVCVWWVVEDGCVERAVVGRSANPVGIGGAEAKVVALVEGFEPAISEKVLSLVSAGKCDLQISLAVVGGSGIIRRDIILSTVNIMVSMQ